jgi:hypothetical protein
MDQQTIIQITLLNNKLNNIELRMNKIENSFRKSLEELKKLNIRYIKFVKDLKDINSTLEYIERKKE